MKKINFMFLSRRHGSIHGCVRISIDFMRYLEENE